MASERDKSAAVPRCILFSYENLLPSSQADAEVVLNTAGALAKRGHQVTLSVPAPPSVSSSFERDVLHYYGIEAPLKVTPMPSNTRNIAVQHIHHVRHFSEHPTYCTPEPEAR